MLWKNFCQADQESVDQQQIHGELQGSYTQQSAILGLKIKSGEKIQLLPHEQPAEDSKKSCGETRPPTVQYFKGPTSAPCLPC